MKQCHPSRRALCGTLLVLLLPCAAGYAQTAAKTDAAAGDKRRVTFERNLLPDSPVVGEPGWLLTDRMRRYAVPGLQVAVVTGGKLAWAGGYGQADPKTWRAVTANTLFDAGSISKAVTALAVVKLADEGRFTLDTPVNTLLRTWKLPENEFTRKTPVTLRHLLTHTAGTTVSGMWGYLEKDPKPTVTQILDGLPPATNGAVRVTAEPGKAWRYSGGGYVVLQQMLEDVQNKPFTEIMQETVFKPLGMTRSSFVQGLPPSLRADVAEPTSEAPYFTGKRMNPQMAAGGLYTTAPDLARLIGAIYRSYHGEPGSFLSREMARQMVEPTIIDREPWDRSAPNRRNTQKDQAVGFMRISRNGAPGETKYVYHDGLNAGFRSRMIFDPATGDGAVLLYNSDGPEEFLLEATRGIAAAYGWKDWVSEPIRPVPLSEAELDRYVGRYRRNDDVVVTIRREGNHLVWTDLYTATQPIYPVGGGRFEHREFFGRPSTFAADERGTIVSLDGWPRMPGDAPPVPSEYLLRGELQKGMDALRQDTGISGQRLFDMGFNLLETHRMPDAAVAVFQVSVEKEPKVPGAWDALGDALKRAGKPKEGTAAEKQAALLRSIQDRERQAKETKPAQQ